MIRQTSKLAIGVLLLGSNLVLAEEDMGFGDFGDFAMEEEEPEIILYNKASFKLRWVSDNNFAFGKYNGMTDDDVFVDGDLIWIVDDENGNWSFSVDAADLGLDSRDLTLALRTAGNLKVVADYSETPLNRNDTGLTPFTGEAALTLPATWVSGVNTSDFSPVQITNSLDNKVIRKELSLDINKLFSMGFEVGARFGFEEKSGTMVKGMAVYSNAANPQAVLLPAPVDEEVTEFELRLGYSNDRLTLAARYFLEKFEDEHPLVTWENPYTSGLGPNVDYPAGIGGYANAPDYDYTGYTIAAGYRITDNIRVTVDGMKSESEQQESLQGYTANPNPLLSITTGLPVTMLDASLDVSKLNVGVMTRWDRLTVNLRYRFDERDNTASQYAWQYVRGDGFDQPSADYALFNRPLDHETDLYSVEAIYRFPNRARMVLGYDYEEEFRNFAAVSNTEKETTTFKFFLPRTEKLHNRLEMLVSDLSGSTYEWSRSFFQTLSINLINQVRDDVRWTNHPLLRQYHIANQERTRFDWNTSYFPNESWVVQFSAMDDSVDFDKSELGLLEAETTTGNLSISYVGSETYNSWIWVNYTTGTRLSMGRDFNGSLEKPANQIYPPLAEGSDPTRNYQITQDDNSLSVGIGTEWDVSDAISLNLSYSYLSAEETYDVMAFGARDLVGDDLPDNDYRLNSLVAGFNYEMVNGLIIELEYEYFDFSDTSWQYQGVTFNTIDKVLTTGQLNPDESVSVVTLALSYRF
jgi:MtrB/PioB family decaheme-associated outer membrane protein